jgi:crotonobetainyl-CoA:carnitine CoA-transferase CaiB-like acyl-CoA transferase
MYFMSGKEPGRFGNGHFVHVPYNTFRTRTRHLVIAVVSDASWLALVELLGDHELDRPEFWTQPGRLENRFLIEQRVQRALEAQSCEFWLDAFANARIPAAPVNALTDAFADPQAIAREMKVSVPLPGGGILDQPGNPIKFSESRENIFRAAPKLGQNTRSVLQEFLDIEPSVLNALAASGIIEALP